jgi:Ion channel
LSISPPEDELQSSLAWRPGSRMSRLRSTHSYGLVLVLVVASFVFAALAPDARWALVVLALGQAATLIVALWTSGLARLGSRPAFVVGAIGLCAAVVGIVGSGDGIRGGLALVDVALVAFTVVVIARGVVDQGEVNLQSVRGAICIYLLLGMLFVFIYTAVAALGSGAFFAQGTDGSTGVRVYFSFVTLATLGYGDYTAASSLGHLLSVIEALLGQLYLVVVVALLVGRLADRRRSG